MDEGDASLVGPLLDQIDCPIASMMADGRSRPPRSDSADTEDRGQGRLQGHQHHDRPRHAGIPPGCLTVARKGEIRPLPYFCTKVYLRDVLARIPEHPINRIGDLLPWNITAQEAC